MAPEIAWACLVSRQPFTKARRRCELPSICISYRYVHKNCWWVPQFKCVNISAFAIMDIALLKAVRALNFVLICCKIFMLSHSSTRCDDKNYTSWENGPEFSLNWLTDNDICLYLLFWWLDNVIQFAVPKVSMMLRRLYWHIMGFKLIDLEFCNDGIIFPENHIAHLNFRVDLFACRDDSLLGKSANCSW